MRRLAPVLALALWGGLAAAQELPALYNVTGVAADDVLNLRDAPDATAALVGTLPPDARNVEVVDINPAGTWGLVSRDEGSGWANLSFLRRLPDQTFDDLPAPLDCGGTEPFWTVRVREGSVSFELIGETTHEFRIGDRLRSRNRTDRWALSYARPGAGMEGVVSRGLCSDGMSDRVYGLEGDFLVTDGSGMTLYSGCCSLAAP
ncbi:peptide-binding protein [Oceaniglobus roseus]|uniref:peptide-binding protein n=1 Tax=Oceaniglobus roseus TaxID=1737570 RepID=UPI000C7F1BE7|nr:peptide-binding protein [Kandeliimicrobium roseum]